MKEFMHEFETKYLKVDINNFYFKANLKNEKHMTISDAFPFRYTIFDNAQHLQGWKIHLSPTLDQYPLVLSQVTKILQNKRISFKYVADMRAFTFLSSKNTSISQFGKYITIYPSDKAEFIEIIERIYSEISCETGVQVPSDQRYKNSSFIYYRYGAAFPEYEISNENERNYNIMNGFAELKEDVRKGYFTLPSGIEDPFENSTWSDEIIQEVPVKGHLTNNTFSVNKILRHCATGNVYEGYNDVNNEAVIIKEGRLGGIPSMEEPLYRAQKARMNEFQFFNENSDKYNMLFPKAIDYFYDEDSVFIIMEKLEGKSLKEFITESPILKPEKSEEEKADFIKSLKDIFNQIFDFILQLHSNDLVFNDISDDNFFITAENKVALIDAEGISNIQDNKWYGMGTDRFMYRMPKGIKSEAKDLYMFSQLILYSVIGRNKGYSFDEKYYEKEYSAILYKLPIGTRGLFNAGMMLMNHVLKGNLTSDVSAEFKELLFTDEETSPLNENSLQPKDLIARIGNIEKILLRYYSNLFADNPNNIFKFATSDYHHNRLSLVYGLPGVSLCLRDFNIIDDQQLLDVAHILQEYALKNENISRLNDGLVFGKAGFTLYLSQAGVPMENNHFFFNLIKALSKYNFVNLDFANGLSGIYVSLKLINQSGNYPDLSKWITIVKQHLGSTTWPISKYQGLEYGNTGLAFSLIFAEENIDNWDIAYKNIGEDLQTVKDDSIFSGLSYSVQEWPNIRSPYLFSGSAGSILVLLHYYHNTGEPDWAFLKELVLSLKSPFFYNYGVTYGTTGLALVIMGILLLPNIPQDFKEELEDMLTHKINYVATHFQSNNGAIGFLGDKQSFYADDFGNGGLGILKVFKLYKEYVADKLTWDNLSFSSLPILPCKQENLVNNKEYVL